MNKIVVNQLQKDCYNQANNGFEKDIRVQLVNEFKKEFGEHFDYKFGNVQEDTNKSHIEAKKAEFDLVLHFKDFVVIEVIEGNIQKARYPLDFFEIEVNISLKEVWSGAFDRFVEALESDLLKNEFSKYAPIDFNDYFHMVNNDKECVYKFIRDHKTNKILIYNKLKLKANRITQNEHFRLKVLLEDEGLFVLI